MRTWKKKSKDSFSNVTHYTHVDVQPGGINIQHVEHFHQTDILKALGIELEVKSKSLEDVSGKKAPQRGPQKQFLFIDGKPSVENVKVRNREKERFLRYLSEHNIKSRKLNCTRKDILNDIVTCFLINWHEKGMLAETPSGGAVFRFLTEECNIQTEVTEQSYSNEIKERLNKKIYTTGTLQKVNQCFKI